MSIQYDSTPNLDERWLLAPARGYAADVVRELDSLINAARGDRPLATNIQQILRSARDEIQEEVERTQPHNDQAQVRR